MTYQPIVIGIPADEPCTPEDCDQTCYREDWGFCRESVIGTDCGDIDVQVYCLCEHHAELLPVR